MAEWKWTEHYERYRYPVRATAVTKSQKKMKGKQNHYKIKTEMLFEYPHFFPKVRIRTEETRLRSEKKEEREKRLLTVLDTFLQAPFLPTTQDRWKCFLSRRRLWASDSRSWMEASLRSSSMDLARRKMLQVLMPLTLFYGEFDALGKTQVILHFLYDSIVPSLRFFFPFLFADCELDPCMLLCTNNGVHVIAYS